MRISWLFASALLAGSQANVAVDRLLADVESSVPSNEDIKAVCSAARSPPQDVSFLGRAQNWLESEATYAARLVGVKMHDAALVDSGTQKSHCAALIAKAIVGHSRECFKTSHADADEYKLCAKQFCAGQCGQHTTDGGTGCSSFCTSKSLGLFTRLGGVVQAKVPKLPKKPLTAMTQSEVKVAAREAAGEVEDAMAELQAVQERERQLSMRMVAKAKRQMKDGNKAKAAADQAKSRKKELDAKAAAVRQSAKRQKESNHKKTALEKRVKGNLHAQEASTKTTQRKAAAMQKAAARKKVVTRSRRRRQLRRARRHRRLTKSSRRSSRRSKETATRSR